MNRNAKNSGFEGVSTHGNIASYVVPASEPRTREMFFGALDGLEDCTLNDESDASSSEGGKKKEGEGARGAEESQRKEGEMERNCQRVTPRPGRLVDVMDRLREKVKRLPDASGGSEGD